MGKLSLYSVFHINLAFSSIPRSHYSLILDRCYWPLLEVAQRLEIPFGFEATGYSLELLEKVDQSFVTALKQTWQENRIEFIGSGYTQSIFPLCPAEVNRQNLKLGNEIYQSLLGQSPETAYINEQTYSSGLVDLYREAGYRQIFMEWNNPARYHRYPTEARYRPQQALNPDGSNAITVVWNDSIAFQKLQRLLNQGITQDEYLSYLKQHQVAGETRGFPFYGSDAEIIDYHPGNLMAEYRESQGSQDVQRLVSLLETLKQNPDYDWTTPGAFAHKYPSTALPLRLESAENPLPCKKQPKYNPTRWAVGGRENIHLNTKSFQRYQDLRVLQSLSSDPIEKVLWQYLLEKWGSDFRTHTTEEKALLLQQTAATLQAEIQVRLPQKAPSPQWEGREVPLWNPNAVTWQGPLVLEIQFPAKTLHGYPTLAENVAVEALQIEGIGYYQDGSIRWLKCVLLASLPPLVETILHWESGEKPLPRPDTVKITQTGRSLHLQTEAVSLDLLPDRGGAIKALHFPQLDTQPWVGTIPHGYFEDIGLGADFYSGHIILASKAGEKATDLNTGTLQLPGNLADYPIRIPVQVSCHTEIGSLQKTLYVYRELPRIDLLYHFRFKDVAASSCRVGMMTVLPEAFDRETLAYRTVNGGLSQEIFPLKGHRVTHSDPVSITVSAQHGVGATEGWVAIEDSRNRILLKTYPAAAYAMPMIHYEESQPGYFLRILPSIGEFDDTSHQMWRGHHQVMFSWMGQKASEPVSALLPPYSMSSRVGILPV